MFHFYRASTIKVKQQQQQGPNAGRRTVFWGLVFEFFSNRKEFSKFPAFFK